MLGAVLLGNYPEKHGNDKDMAQKARRRTPAFSVGAEAEGRAPCLTSAGNVCAGVTQNFHHYAHALK